MSRTAEFHAKYPTFEDWSAALDRYVTVELGWTHPIGAKAIEDDWCQYWEEGFDPEEAMAEEMSYGD